VNLDSARAAYQQAIDTGHPDIAPHAAFNLDPLEEGPHCDPMGAKQTVMGRPNRTWPAESPKRSVGPPPIPRPSVSTADNLMSG